MDPSNPPRNSREHDRYGNEGTPGGNPGAQGYGGAGGGGYGGYGGYGYGGYPGYGETVAQRSLQDYLLILRERVWYIVTAFVVVVAAAAIYTFTRTPLYQSASTVEIFRRNPTVMQVQQVMDSEVRSAEDLNTQVNILKSARIIQRVAARLKDEDLRRFMAPYEKDSGSAQLSLVRLLELNRDIVPQRLSLIVAIQYKHADKEMAAKVANLFATEYISFSADVRTEESRRAVVELEQGAAEQRKKVDQLAQDLQVYREKKNLVSLNQRTDIATETLKELNRQATMAGAALQDAETRWKQVQEVLAGSTDPLNLPFIASVETVSRLQQDVAAKSIVVKGLTDRYRAKHPDMMAAVGALEESRKQLQMAINNTISQVEANYQTALRNYNKVRESLAAQTKESLSVDRYGVEYTKMAGDYELANGLLDGIMKRGAETAMSNSAVQTQSARLVDLGEPGRKPVSPNKLLNLSLGAVGGLGFGLALAFFVAYADDRVKSAYDIEAVVGLPLLSIVPKFKIAPSDDDSSAPAFTPPKEPEINEAFSTLYSSLRLKPESKNAKCIIITSTVPGEGKSFITRNLALTFASHGERVLLIDCDLRRPVVHRAFHVENLKGVIDICQGGVPSEDVILKNIQPNLDLLPSGGRSKSPAQDLSSRNFEVLLVELRKRYDRIFIDTPPIALVSDALVILPLVDGSIYSIFFNKVRRKAAQYCVRRLVEVNVPSFGAVLNGLNRNIGGYYYHHYYDRKYKDYYVNTEEGRSKGAAGRGGKV